MRIPELGFDLTLLVHDGILVLLAFALALPIGWERGHGRRSVGFGPFRSWRWLPVDLR
jgi:putative Mg2+ transporter-C (MgtC) family protein